MIDNIIELRIKVYYEKKGKITRNFFFSTRSRIDTRLTCREISNVNVVDRVVGQ